MGEIMTLDQIKKAVDLGQKVYWKNEGYQVIKDKKGQYLILHCSGSCIGLYSQNNVLNGDESDFFVKSNCVICGNYIVRDKECLIRLYNNLNSLPHNTNKNGNCPEFRKVV